MSGFPRAGRRPDGWASPHLRARTRAAERLTERLDPAEADWLENHLGECGACAGIADDYAQQQQELRALGAADVVPPRDLWSRTATALDRESERGRLTPASRRRRSALPLGVASGLLVVVVVTGASLLSRSPVPVVRTTPPPVANSEPSPSVFAAATPLGVNAGTVAWLRSDQDGMYRLYLAAVREVCPGRERGTCAPLDDPQPVMLNLREVPLSAVISPSARELVIYNPGTPASGGAVYVLPAPTTALEPSASPEPTTAPEPSGSPDPSGPSPDASPPGIPSGSPTPAPSPSPSASPVPIASPSPGTSPSPGPSTSPSPDASPSDVPEGAVTIATDVILVGDAAAYSPDGRWFAFSARPADGSHGPDLYLWQVGEPEARRITDDHRSVFSSWIGNLILASRASPASDAPEPDPGPTDGGTEPDISPRPRATAGSLRTPGPTPTADRTAATPRPTIGVKASPTATSEADATAGPQPSAAVTGAPDGTPRGDGGHGILVPGVFLVDPETGEEIELDGSLIWRPTVDPTGTSAVYWSGTLALAEDGVTVRPEHGRLVVGPWVGSADAREPQEIEVGELVEWEARWDPTGTRFALWVADPVDPTIGRLSLFMLDPLTGRIDDGTPPLRSVPALAGFSLANGRLAWVTPPGQDGQGSRVQVLAWAGDEVGTVETLPGNDRILIVR